MFKRLFLTVTFIFSILSLTVTAQIPAASETDAFRPGKKEIVEWINQLSKMPVAQQNESAEAALKGISSAGSKTPRSDFQLCAGLAFLGNAKAQRCLGYAYEKGFGVVNDLEEAYVWFELAHQGGDKESAADVSRIVLVLNSAYPAPSEDELEMMTIEQKRTIAEYQKEIKK